jgi:hypothetical protein
MTQPKFLVSGYWRGALNVDQMRVFTDISLALKYYHDVHAEPSMKRMHAVYGDKPPVNVMSGKVTREKYGIT